MASLAAVLGSVIAVLLLVAPSVAARPCKTLLVSYSFTIERKPYPNPSLNHNLDVPSSRFLVFTSTYVNTRPSFLTFDLDEGRLPLSLRQRHIYPELPQRIASEPEVESKDPVSWFDLRSFRDRAVDILSVVLALLFGVGCGALTAATMFLVWSFCSNNRGEGFEEEDEEDLSSIKKMGYVKIVDDVKVPEPTKA